MFSNDIYLKSNTLGTPRKFVLTNVDGTDKVRTFEDSVPGLPETHRIAHQTRGKTSAKMLAHLVQLQKTKVDSFGAKQPLKYGLTIEHSEGSYTVSEIKIGLEEFLSFFLTPETAQSVAASIVAGLVDTAVVRDLSLGAS